MASETSTAATSRPGASLSSADYPDAKPLLVAACGGTFLAYLDVTVVTITFPELHRSFAGYSVDALSWVLSAYIVAFAALLPIGGKLSDAVGHRRFFVGGITLFLVASAVAAVADSLELLVGARVVQGIGAAAMIPAALGLILEGVPPERRGIAIGVWGAVSSLAAALGPTIGGLLVEVDSWRLVFVVNVPLGALLVAYTLRRVSPRAPAAAALPDWLGSVLLTVACGALVVSITQSDAWGWGDARVVGGCLLAIVAGVFTVVRSGRAAHPALELQLWRDPTFSVVTLTSLVFGASMFAWMLIGPLFLSVIWKYSVITAALAVTPGAVTAAIAAIVIGKRSSPAALRAGVVAGALALAAATLAQAIALTGDPQYLTLWLPVSLIGGFGLGLTLTGLASAAAGTLPPTSFAAGTGLVMASRQLGGALGIAVTAIILGGAAVGLSDFHAAFAFCAAAAIAAAATAAALVVRPRDRATISNAPGELG